MKKSELKKIIRQSIEQLEHDYQFNSKQQSDDYGYGWRGKNQDEFQEILDQLQQFSKIEYQIKNCTKGSYTRCKTSFQLCKYIITHCNELIDLCERRMN